MLEDLDTVGAFNTCTAVAVVVGGGYLLSSSRETGPIFLARLFGVHPDPSIFFPTADSTLAELICRNRRTPIARRGSTADVVWDPRRPRY